MKGMAPNGLDTGREEWCAMDFVVLRLIHVLGGAFWLGAAVTMFLFLQPTAQATVPESQRFMLHLLRNRRFSEVVLAAALLTGVAGAILFWRDTSGLRLALITQPQGLGFTVGGLAGAIALLLFLFVGYPVGRRMIAIGGKLEAERRPPSVDEQRVLASAQRVLSRVGGTVLVLLVIAAGAMATARYWPLVL
jgi:uncharacterized membrane protein